MKKTKAIHPVMFKINIHPLKDSNSSEYESWQLYSTNPLDAYLPVNNKIHPAWVGLAEAINKNTQSNKYTII